MKLDHPSIRASARAPILCHVTSIDELEHKAGDATPAARILRESLQANADALVRTTEDPAAADLIVFAETPNDTTEHGDCVQRILQSSQYRTHRAKVVVHSGKDVPRPRIPGFYPSILSRTAAWLGCEGAPYLTVPNPFLLGQHGWDGSIRRLATFRGACGGKKTRLKLLQVGQAEGWSRMGIELMDTGDPFLATLRSGDHLGHLELKRVAIEAMLASLFSICPEGVGLSSFRIFEAMQLGRAPVIIADGWARPAGLDWEAFALFLSPNRLGDLPDLLHRHQDRATAMGMAARRAWEESFAPPRLASWLVSRSHAILERWNAARGRHEFRASVHEAFSRRLDLARRRLSHRFLGMA